MDHFIGISIWRTIFLPPHIKLTEHLDLICYDFLSNFFFFFFHCPKTHRSTTFAIILYWIHCSAFDAEYKVNIPKTNQRLVYTVNSPVSENREKRKRKTKKNKKIVEFMLKRPIDSIAKCFSNWMWQEKKKTYPNVVPLNLCLSLSVL